MEFKKDKLAEIIEVLKKHGDNSLTREFQMIVAMAKSRQQAKNAIENHYIPIFQHLIPFAIFINKNVEPPTSWKKEIKAFFGNIDFMNASKKRQWFSDIQIQEMFDESLDFYAKKRILSKLEDFKNKQQLVLLKKEIEEFFSNNKKLIDLGIKLKYQKDEENLLSLSLYINNQKIF